MANEILPYIEMCRREGVSLQRGMNYELGGNHSVILMSVLAHRMRIVSKMMDPRSFVGGEGTL